MRLAAALVILIASSAAAAAYTLSGSVFDADSGKPLNNAAVGIMEHGAVTESGSGGVFVIRDIPRSVCIVSVTRPGYRAYERKISLNMDRSITVRMEKDPYLQELISPPEKKEGHPGYKSISREDIKKYPMRGFGDSLHLLQSLPGIGGGSSLSTVPIIRGQNPLYTKYYIDGVPVDFPYHYAAAFMPMLSSLNEESIDSASLNSGPEAAALGDNLGAAVIINTRSAEAPGLNARIHIDPFLPLFPGISFTAVPYAGFSASGNAMRTTTDILGDFEYTDSSMRDHFLKMEWNPHSSHRLTAFTTGSSDSFSYKKWNAASSSSVSSGLHEFAFNDMIAVRTRLSHYGWEQSFENKQLYENGTGARVVFNPSETRFYQEAFYARDSFSASLGWEYAAYSGGCRGNISLEQIGDIDLPDLSSLNEYLVFPVEGRGLSSFCSAQGSFGKYSGELALRYEHYGPLDTHSVTWSAKAAMSVLKGLSVYLSAGRSEAHPDIYYYLGSSNPSFENASSLSFEAGAEASALKIFTFNAALYTADYDNLNPGAVYTVSDEYLKRLLQIHPFSDENSGRSFGSELSAAWNYKRLSGRAAYSFCSTKMNTSSGQEAPSEFSQSHIFRLLLDTHSGRWTWSFIWSAYSSLPYTPVTSQSENGTAYGDYNSARFNAHNRVDLKAAYTFPGGSRISVELWNAFFQSNTVFEYYREGRALSSSNPEKFDDIPVFLWVAAEVSL